MKTHGDTKNWRLLAFAAAVLSVGCRVDSATAPDLFNEPLMAAGGGGAHFGGAKADVNELGNLVISFKIIGADVGADVTGTADATATAACLFEGVLSGTLTGSQTVSWTDSFSAGTDGKIAGSITLPMAGVGLRCAAPAAFVVVSVSYTNVQLSSPTAGTKQVSGTFARTFF